MSNRNLAHIKNIIKYCNDILELQTSFGGKSYTSFTLHKGYQYSVSFCIEQIGELAKKLRDEGFADKYPDIEWNDIAGMRNRIAHGYDSIDLEMVYDIAVEDVPKLLKDCQYILEQETSLEVKIEAADKLQANQKNDKPARNNREER